MNLMLKHDRSVPDDSCFKRVGMLLTVVGALASLGWIAQKSPETPKPPGSLRKPTADDFVRTGDDFMQLQRESHVSRLHDLAEKDYRSALALDPSHAEALLGLAWVNSTRHDFTNACDYARQALRINPRLYPAYALLSDAAVELGNYDKAFEHCQTALDLAPNLSSYSRAAHLVWITGDPEQAHELMQKAIRSGGTHPEHVAWCRVELAQMHLQAGAMTAAEEEAAQALRALPRHPRMLLTMGKIKAAQGDLSAAETYFAQALQIDPSHEVLLAHGELQLRQNRHREAEKTFQRLIKLHAADPSHPAQLARFYADHDRNLPAALVAAEAAHHESGSVFVLDTLAWCLHKTGDNERAKIIIKKALKWNTPDACIYYHASMIYSELGDRETARGHLQKVWKLNPVFPLPEG